MSKHSSSGGGDGGGDSATAAGAGAAAAAAAAAGKDSALRILGRGASVENIADGEASRALADTEAFLPVLAELSSLSNASYTPVRCLQEQAALFAVAALVTVVPWCQLFPREIGPFVD